MTWLLDSNMFENVIVLKNGRKRKTVSKRDQNMSLKSVIWRILVFCTHCCPGKDEGVYEQMADFIYIFSFGTIAATDLPRHMLCLIN